MLTSFPTGVGFGRALDHAAKEIENGMAASGLAEGLSALTDLVVKCWTAGNVRLFMIVIIFVAFLYALTRPISK